MPKVKKKSKKPKAKTDGGYRSPTKKELGDLISGSALKEGRTGLQQFARAYDIVAHSFGSPREMKDLYDKIPWDERQTLAQMAEQYAREQHKPLSRDAVARLTEDAPKPTEEELKEQRKLEGRE